MRIAYPVIFTQTGDKKDTYLVYIPDMDGSTEGYGLPDAIHMARDYIGCMLYDKEEKDYPKPTSISDVDSTKGIFSDSGESMVSVVDIDIEEYAKKMDNTPVRRNVSLPRWLNQEVGRRKINVSRVLQDALMEKINMR